MMEKTIKMSLETAKIIFEQTKKEGSPTNFMLYTWLMENFTKEELEGKKGFTWEDGFDGNGWYIDNKSEITRFHGGVSDSTNKNVYKTEAQAKSAIAFAQLSHIVSKYNEGKTGGALAYSICARNLRDGFLEVLEMNFGEPLLHLIFLREEDAKLSMEANRQLWLDYWMIGSVTVKSSIVQG